MLYACHNNSEYSRNLTSTFCDSHSSQAYRSAAAEGWTVNCSTRYLSRRAIMVQPLDLPDGIEVAGLRAVHIPLLPVATGSTLQGMLLLLPLYMTTPVCLHNRQTVPHVYACQGTGFAKELSKASIVARCNQAYWIWSCIE